MNNKTLTIRDIEHFKKLMNENNGGLYFECLNTTTKLKLIESFDISRELIPVEHIEILSKKSFFEDGEDINDVQTLTDRINDYCFEIGREYLPKEFLLDLDYNKKLFLEPLRGESSFKVIGDNVAIYKMAFFQTRGADSYTILKDIDLTRFLKRSYEKPDNYNHMDDKEGITSKPCKVVSFPDGQAYIPNEIDHTLFKSWAVHQFVKRIFKCTNEPFFEREGMIHQKTIGTTKIEPEYILPKDFNFQKMVKTLKMSVQYVSNQNLLATDY